jgi:hypothetical protein
LFALKEGQFKAREYFRAYLNDDLCAVPRDIQDLTLSVRLSLQHQPRQYLTDLSNFPFEMCGWLRHRDSRPGLKLLTCPPFTLLFLQNEQRKDEKELSYAALHYAELSRCQFQKRLRRLILEKQTPPPIAPKTSPPGLGVGLEKPAKLSLLKKAGKPRRSALFSAHTLAAS